MREIEKEMMNAIYSLSDFKKGNTKVTHWQGKAWVTLHGNLIAVVEYKAGPVDNYRLAVTVIKDTLKAWPTVTTLSRLKALGVNVYRKDNKIYLDDMYLCGV